MRFAEQGGFGEDIFRVRLDVGDVNRSAFQRNTPGNRPASRSNRVRFEECAVLGRPTQCGGFAVDVAVERLMTLSTSLVAVWYSSDSCKSSVRACNSPSSRAFSIAITAWSAKVRTNSICRSLNGSIRCRASTIVPITSPSRSRGTPSAVRAWRFATSG
jgi:hypothetical protein